MVDLVDHELLAGSVGPRVRIRRWAAGCAGHFLVAGSRGSAVASLVGAVDRHFMTNVRREISRARQLDLVAILFPKNVLAALRLNAALQLLLTFRRSGGVRALARAAGSRTLASVLAGAGAGRARRRIGALCSCLLATWRCVLGQRHQPKRQNCGDRDQNVSHRALLN